MGKKLAIKSHITRGKEVIELLKMMGGCESGYCGGGMGFYYYISQYGNIEGSCEPHEFDNYIVYTLEEFLEKYPYKVGDLVDRNIDYVSCVIDNMRWNSKKCCVEYHAKTLNGSNYGWHVSECFVNNKTTTTTKKESTMFMQMGKTVSVIFNSENYEDEVELQLGDYEIAVRDGKTYAIRKKPTYPKTIIEVLDYWHPNRELEDDYQCIYKKELIKSFQLLLYCRDAYWKIAGNWKPDWNNISDKYTIYPVSGEIWLDKGQTINTVLAFPTQEMRNIFFENFKDLIVKCKELL
jgi:hypothetical protein